MPEKPDIQTNPIFRDAWYSYKPDMQKPLVLRQDCFSKGCGLHRNLIFRGKWSSEKPASRRKLSESRERERERDEIKKRAQSERERERERDDSCTVFQ